MQKKRQKEKKDQNVWVVALLIHGEKVALLDMTWSEFEYYSRGAFWRKIFPSPDVRKWRTKYVLNVGSFFLLCGYWIPSQDSPQLATNYHIDENAPEQKAPIW